MQKIWVFEENLEKELDLTIKRDKTNRNTNSFNPSNQPQLNNVHQNQSNGSLFIKQDHLSQNASKDSLNTLNSKS